VQLAALGTVAMCASGSSTSMSASSSMSRALTSPALSTRTIQRLGGVDVHLERHLLEVEDDVGRILHHAGIGENSCSTPSIFTAVTAAPSIEESSTRRRALPMVVPNPRSNGCAKNRPNLSVSVSRSNSSRFGR
jgi:hypothetical protein